MIGFEEGVDASRKAIELDGPSDGSGMAEAYKELSSE